MTLGLVLLFCATITCDVAGQLFFKIGAERLPDFHGPDRSLFWRGLVTDWWLLAGIVTYAAELVIWLRILSEAPLSIAFPIVSANFLGVALVSRLFLKEKISATQWGGAGLVTFGVALVASAA